MKRAKTIALSLVAASFLIQPKFVFADDISTSSDGNQSLASEAPLFAAIDYCHSGMLQDPTTGEIVELYVLCPEDGFEQNIDFA